MVVTTLKRMLQVQHQQGMFLIAMSCVLRWCLLFPCVAPYLCLTADVWDGDKGLFIVGFLRHYNERLFLLIMLKRLVHFYNIQIEILDPCK